MADNVGLATGSGGATIGTDELVINSTTVHIQRVKAGWGPTGTYNEPDDAAGKRYPIKVGDTGWNVGGAAGATDAGMVFLAVRDEALTELTATEGDLVHARTASNGAVWVKHSGSIALSTTATIPVSVGNTATVAVESVIPGVGANNLGKAIDNVAGATDTGVAILAKHQEDQVHLASADADYDILSLDSLGSLHVNAEAHHVFDTFNATTDWTVLGNDTINLATTKKHVSGTDALSFDKTDGLANTVIAGIQKTITSVDLGAVSPHDILQGNFYIPTISAVDYAFLRLGTDSTNYNEWQVPVANLTAAVFLTGALTIGDADYDAITGNGWDASAITYIAVGVAFNDEADALAGIVFDEVSYHTNQHGSVQIAAEITSTVSSANINMQKVGGSPTDKNAGNASAGSQRIVIASDDLLMATMATGIAQIATTVDANGVLKVTNAGTATVPVRMATGTEVYNFTNAGTATQPVSIASTVNVGGGWAHSSTSTGNPVYTGGIARSSRPTAVSAGEVVESWHDPHGRQVVMPVCVRGDVLENQFTVSATTIATMATAGAAGLFHDMLWMTLMNNATTEAQIRIRSTSTSTKWAQINLAADGGGISFHPSRPAIQSAAAGTWDLQLAGEITGQVDVSAEFMRTT